MIRVITEDTKDRFYDCDKVIELRNARIDYENKFIYYDGDFDYASIWFGDIVKIEKQVKDLTFEEISKLKAQVIVVHTAPIKIVDAIPIYGSKVEKAEGKGYNTYKLDWNDHFYDLEDYIDIIDLVKDND